MHFRGFPGIFEHRAPPYVPYISVDFARFLGTEVPPGYHTLAEMYERGGATLEALRGGVCYTACPAPVAIFEDPKSFPCQKTGSFT